MGTPTFLSSLEPVGACLRRHAPDRIGGRGEIGGGVERQQWGATGGGVSEIFPLPDWQSEVNVPTTEDGHRGRGILDLAANASPYSGYLVRLHGTETVVGGTSASAPFLAGLIALMNQSLGRNLGHINPLLYAKIGPAGVIHNITSGDNGVQGVKGYPAGPGWNACTGWGSPDGRKLLEALRATLNDQVRGNSKGTRDKKV